MPDSIQMQVTIEAEAEVTKAADIRQWIMPGVFEDDVAMTEVGNGAVYLRTGGDAGITCMLTPQAARDFARCLTAAADKSETKKEDER